MTVQVTLKDWERMQDLLDRDKDGEDVAKKINKKEKAIARYVAGRKLIGKPVLEEGHLPWCGTFRAFGEKALSLGATFQDLLDTDAAASLPEDFHAKHKTKKSYTGYTGSMYRLLDNLQQDLGVKYTVENSNSQIWSWETKEQYSRNGRVWPLNYKITIENDRGETKVYELVVVTNEGGGLYGYDLNRFRMQWGMIKERIEREVAEFVNKAA